MAGPYRDAARGPSRRRVEADERIAACEVRMMPALSAFLSPELRERIEHLRHRVTEDDDDLRAQLADALEEAVEVARERQLDLRYLPDEHPPAPPLEDVWGPDGSEAAASSVASEVRTILRACPGAQVGHRGPRVTARFTERGAAILWSIHLRARTTLIHGVEEASFEDSSHWMAVLAGDDLPSLFLRREGMTDTVLKAMGFRREVEVADERFDDSFFVEGDAAFTRALLRPELRAALLRRAAVGKFTFLLDGSIASLAWKSDLTAGLAAQDVFGPSSDVLVAFRGALEGLQLLV